MNVMKASVQFMQQVDGPAILKHLEACGRVCYKSEGRITDGSAEKFVRDVIKRGHEAVLEHASVTVKFICDRGVSHEIVRHRLASYCQESTRYCNYSKDEFGREITVIEPGWIEKPADGLPKTTDWYAWEYAMEQSEKSYFGLLRLGWTPQQARSVLPNSLKTEVVMTTNMRELALSLLEQFHDAVPVIFDDIYEEVHHGEEE